MMSRIRTKSFVLEFSTDKRASNLTEHDTTLILKRYLLKMDELTSPSRKLVEYFSLLMVLLNREITFHLIEYQIILDVDESFS